MLPMQHVANYDNCSFPEQSSSTATCRVGSISRQKGLVRGYNVPLALNQAQPFLIMVTTSSQYHQGSGLVRGYDIDAPLRFAKTALSIDCFVVESWRIKVAYVSLRAGLLRPLQVTNGVLVDEDQFVFFIYGQWRSAYKGSWDFAFEAEKDGQESGTCDEGRGRDDHSSTAKVRHDRTPSTAQTSLACSCLMVLGDQK